jgi:3'(2'), 5'-bisphosphate nucleotidase
MIDQVRPETSFALNVVKQAAQLAKKICQEMLSPPSLSKDDRSPVTVADFATQALISHALANSFPNDCFIAEEDTGPLKIGTGQQTLQQITNCLTASIPDISQQQACDLIDRGRGECATRFWTLDPIDGTKGFLRGDQYAVALALVEEGQVQVGVLGCPNLDEGWLVIAARGEGCWKTSLNGHEIFDQLQVSDCTKPQLATILRSFESAHTNEEQMKQLQKSLGTQNDPLPMDSQAKYAVLAAGKGDLLFRLPSPTHPNYQEKIWDHATGSLLVEEAGGRVTDLDGNNLDFSQGRFLSNSRGILASNDHLHSIALEVLSSQSCQ